MTSSKEFVRNNCHKSLNYLIEIISSDKIFHLIMSRIILIFSILLSTLSHVLLWWGPHLLSLLLACDIALSSLVVTITCCGGYVIVIETTSSVWYNCCSVILHSKMYDVSIAIRPICSESCIMGMYKLLPMKKSCLCWLELRSIEDKLNEANALYLWATRPRQLYKLY